MAEVILDRPGILAVIGELVADGVAQHECTLNGKPASTPARSTSLAKPDVCHRAAPAMKWRRCRWRGGRERPRAVIPHRFVGASSLLHFAQRDPGVEGAVMNPRRSTGPGQQALSLRTPYQIKAPWVVSRFQIRWDCRVSRLSRVGSRRHR
jgi:hypothetical protein